MKQIIIENLLHIAPGTLFSALSLSLGKHKLKQKQQQYKPATVVVSRLWSCIFATSKDTIDERISFKVKQVLWTKIVLFLTLVISLLSHCKLFTRL